MFTAGMKEARERDIVLEDVKYEHFLKLIHYLYTGSTSTDGSGITTNNPKDAIQMLALADRFAILPLKRQCVQTLMQSISLDNCFSYLDIASKFTCNDLRDASLQVICKHFTTLRTSDSFTPQFVDVHNLCLLLDHPDLLEPEDRIFEAVLHWLKKINTAAIASTDRQIEGVLERIRWPLLSAKYLVSDVKSQPLVMKFPIMQSLLLEAFEYISYPETPNLGDCPRVKRRERRASSGNEDGYD